MTKKPFAALNTYRSEVSHSAAMNMAIDEVLLERAELPTIRFYRWDHPALSFGYFGRFADVAAYARECDLARRWTGGGIVFHGEDLTYAIVIPRSEPAFAQSSMSIYEKIHGALIDALREMGAEAVVAAVIDDGASVTEASYGKQCFTNPVQADVMLDGRKIAGAAQRRTRRGLLQQGSIQLATGRVRPTGGHVDLSNELEERFAHALSLECEMRQLGPELLERAREIAQQKYATEMWLRKR